MIVCEVDVGIDIVAEQAPSFCLLVGIESSDRDMKLDTPVLREETGIDILNNGRDGSCTFYDE